MPKSKSKRVSAGTRKTMTHQKTVPVVRVVTPSERLARAHVLIIESLNRLIDGTGNFQDWNNIVVRLHLGALAVDDYFVSTPELLEAFNQANISMRIIMLRVHTQGLWGVLVRELDTLTLALSLTDQMIRMMRPSEIATTVKIITTFFDELPDYNKNMAKRDEHAAMFKSLKAERLEAKELPVGYAPDIPEWATDPSTYVRENLPIVLAEPLEAA